MIDLEDQKDRKKVMYRGREINKMREREIQRERDGQFEKIIEIGMGKRTKIEKSCYSFDIRVKQVKRQTDKERGVNELFCCVA